MKDTNGSDDWRTLCELATKENNPQKLLELISRINQALEESHRQSRRDEAVMKIDTVLPLTGCASQSEVGFYSFPSQPSLYIDHDR